MGDQGGDWTGQQPQGEVPTHGEIPPPAAVPEVPPTLPWSPPPLPCPVSVGLGHVCALSGGGGVAPGILRMASKTPLAQVQSARARPPVQQLAATRRPAILS